VNSFVFRHYTPKGRLANFVEIFWYWQGHEILKGKEHALPSPGIELVIDLSNTRKSYSVISGPRSKPFIIGNSKEEALLGIHFRPGGIFPFLPFPVSDIHNTDITLDTLWGQSGANQLLEQLHGATEIETRFNVLEKWLLSNILHPLKHHPAVHLALAELEKEPSLSTAVLAEKVNLSQRRFIQLFQKQIGFSPKLFSRLQRFHRALEVVGMHAQVDWSDVASLCGYFDQAHFNHDFREFSGVTPTRYLHLRIEHRGHLPAHN
jgi:AraC-like DNA-binding protein